MIYQHLLENGNMELLPHVSILPWDQSEYPVRRLVQQCSNQVEFHSLCTCRGKQSLYEMIKAFEIFLPLVRGNLPLLEDLAVDFCKRQAQQHVVYTEMRYSPHLLATGGSLEYKENATMVNADVVVDAITRGLRRGQELYHVTVNQILCCITWRPDWANGCGSFGTGTTKGYSVCRRGSGYCCRRRAFRQGPIIHTCIMHISKP